jgi:hypothetical protein
MKISLVDPPTVLGLEERRASLSGCAVELALGELDDLRRLLDREKLLPHLAPNPLDGPQLQILEQLGVHLEFLSMARFDPP